MVKKHKDTDFDDFDDAEMIEDAGIPAPKQQAGFPQQDPFMMGGIVPKFDDNYSPIDIENTGKDLKKKAQDLVVNICDIYYKLDDSNEDDPTAKYLEGLKKVEIMNLENLLLQVKASEHMLYSLLGRLNATGSIDNSLYKLISETQEKSIDLTLQVSNYIRSLPTYFKQLRFELSTNVEMVKVEQTQEMLELKQDTEDDPDKFIQKPQKGMRAFLKQVEEAEEEMKKQNETVEDNDELPQQPNILETRKDEPKLDDVKARLLEENEEE